MSFNETPPNRLNISLDQTQPVYCGNCGYNVFNQGIFLRKAPRLLTGSPVDSYLPIPVFYCVKCKHVNEEFLPKEQQSL
jgi:hypothetical protein